MISKPKVTFVVFLLCAAAVGTVNSQTTLPVRPVDSTHPRRDNSALIPKPNNKSEGVKGRARSSPAKLNAKFVNDGRGFLLICRGGPDLRFDKSDSRPDPRGYGFPPYAYAQITTMTVDFQRSASPAHSGRILQPGQCSPAEFSLRDIDPAQIQASVTIDGQWARERDGLPVDRRPIIAETYPDVFNISEYLKDPNHYWGFGATDSGKGYFDATPGKYWKPEFYEGPKVSPVDPKRTKDVLVPKKP